MPHTSPSPRRAAAPCPAGPGLPLRALPTLAVIAALFAGAAAWGQDCGVRNIMRLVNRVVGGAATEDVFIDTESVVAAPLISFATASDANDFGASTSASWTATSDYGRLAFAGSGTGTSTEEAGLTMWLDVDPHAQFIDRAAVQSTSLPNGTPVTIRATASYAGTAGSSDPTAQVIANAAFHIDDLEMQLNTSNNLMVAEFNTSVGASVTAIGLLNCTLRPFRIQSTGQAYTDTVQANISAEITFTVLTPGVTLSWCSGASYEPNDVCPADLGSQGGAHGSDGVLDNNDFIVFIDLFFSQSPLADRGVTGGVPGSDGAWDNNDFIVFIDQFFTGC